MKLECIFRLKKSGTIKTANKWLELTAGAVLTIEFWQTIKFFKLLKLSVA